MESSRFDWFIVELPLKRSRSSTGSSEVLELHHLAKKADLHDYMKLKMDLLAQDLSDLRSESDPTVIIKLFYGNALTVIKTLLKPHFAKVKMAADQHCQLGLHQWAMGENAIASAESIDSLLSQMSVMRMWDSTRFLRKAVGAIPVSANERGVAEAILSHYNIHLAIYERATLLKDALAEGSEHEKEQSSPRQDDMLVPLNITALKSFDNFTCEDCYRLQVRILSTAYGIPQEKIVCYDAKESQSTTVTFLIPSHCALDVIQRSVQLETLWILLEQCIIEVCIPGVFIFSPSVDVFLTLLRERKTFTADLLQVTEVRNSIQHIIVIIVAARVLSNLTTRPKHPSELH